MSPAKKERKKEKEKTNGEMELWKGEECGGRRVKEKIQEARRK